MKISLLFKRSFSDQVTFGVKMLLFSVISAVSWLTYSCRIFFPDPEIVILS